MMVELKVRKKDGRIEPFDRSKMASGIQKSGASPEEAEKIASQVEAWAQSAAVDGVISTSELRTKVLELLRATNPTVATSFEGFKRELKES